MMFTEYPYNIKYILVRTKKENKNALLLFLPTKVSRRRGIYDADALNGKRTSS